jgi:hypothetical protein
MRIRHGRRTIVEATNDVVFAALVGAVVASLVACPPDPKPPLPIVPGDCSGAESRLRALGCSGDLSPDGFADFCVEEAGKGLNLHPECIARATSCEEADRATRGC